MGIEHVRRWHWITIALIVGLTLGLVRELAGGDPTSRFDRVLSGQAEFERALLEKGDGVPRFRDVVVYEENVPGTDQTVYVVGGLYTQFITKDGQTFATPPVRTCFVFPTPYQPLSPQAQPEPNSTVVDYLDSLKPQGVRYRLAWWNAPAASVTLWILASLALIGGLWPTLVNLIAFGQLTQPPRDSFNVGGARADTESASDPKITDEDLAKLEQLDAALEAQLAAGAASRDQPAPQTSPASIKPLTAGPLEPVTADQSAADREFGADRDDFYPTERHAPAKRPG